MGGQTGSHTIMWMSWKDKIFQTISTEKLGNRPDAPEVVSDRISLRTQARASMEAAQMHIWSSPPMWLHPNPPFTVKALLPSQRFFPSIVTLSFHSFYWTPLFFFFLVLFRVAAGQDISAIPNRHENHFPRAPLKLDDSITPSEGPNSTTSLGNHTSWDSLLVSPLYLPWPI